MDSYVEEVTEALSPETLVRENAARKGRKVAAAVAPDALVIAADTVVADERGILGKPKDREEAVRMLRRLSGRTHKVHTGLYVSLGGKEHLSVTTTQVTFCPLTDRLIHRYIGTGWGLWDPRGGRPFHSSHRRLLQQCCWSASCHSFYSTR